MVRQLEGDGLVSLHGEKWAHHRKVLTPAFYMDNLKVITTILLLFSFLLLQILLRFDC
jgi:PHYB activation tagged suppressor 1